MHTGAFQPAADLVQLDADHPGFRDPEYRARRNAIARLALEYRGGPVPEVEYTPDEQEVWRRVWERLDPLHAQWACQALREAEQELPLDRREIPQLAALNPRLTAASGFEMLPVAGLVSARTFLAHLGEGVFLSTQYMRHPSAPLYTPEPDLVHELVGHAASLAHAELAALSRALGRAAARADEAGLKALERVYWFTLEFGAVAERGQVKALGAGLLSSVGELERLPGGPHLPWDLPRIAATPYDPTTFQPGYFVAPSFARLLDDLGAWAARELGA
jgi:phenylalanine-4-hydroxylase